MFVTRRKKELFSKSLPLVQLLNILISLLSPVPSVDITINESNEYFSRSHIKFI